MARALVSCLGFPKSRVNMVDSNRLKPLDLLHQSIKTKLKMKSWFKNRSSKILNKIVFQRRIRKIKTMIFIYNLIRYVRTCEIEVRDRREKNRIDRIRTWIGSVNLCGCDWERGREGGRGRLVFFGFLRRVGDGGGSCFAFSSRRCGVSGCPRGAPLIGLRSVGILSRQNFSKFWPKKKYYFCYFNYLLFKNFKYQNF